MSEVKDKNADAILVRQCLAGDNRAFDALVRKYHKPLYNLALRMVRDRDDAMDIVQGVFVKVYQKLGSFDERHPEGLYRIGASHLYVSRGIGTTFTPVRLSAPPEVTLFELT